MWWWLAACERGSDGKEGSTDPTATDADTDTDTDSDTDADSDADTDADADADTDADTGLVWDADHVLVVPTGDGLTLLAADGSAAFEATWTELVGSCSNCGGEGASDDGDGLLLAFTTSGPTSGGAVARLDGSGALDWRVDGFGFPHDIERDPADDTFVVVETQRNRLTWIDDTSADSLRALDSATDDWTGDLPNGAERVTEGGRTYLLLSHRGQGGGGGGSSAAGYLSLWDVTTAGAPERVWRFPPSGNLRTPHGPVFRWHDGHRWLLYAHTEGVSGGGSVGVALADDLTAAPTYVADLRPTGAEAPFDFLRGVELTTDGDLWLTDSGPGNGGSAFAAGRVLRLTFPSGLAAATPSGAYGDQLFVDVSPELFVDGLVNPFEGWLWRNTFP